MHLLRFAQWMLDCFWTTNVFLIIPNLTLIHLSNLGEIKGHFNKA